MGVGDLVDVLSAATDSSGKKRKKNGSKGKRGREGLMASFLGDRKTKKRMIKESILKPEEVAELEDFVLGGKNVGGEDEEPANEKVDFVYSNQRRPGKARWKIETDPDSEGDDGDDSMSNNMTLGSMAPDETAKRSVTPTVKNVPNWVVQARQRRRKKKVPTCDIKKEENEESCSEEEHRSGVGLGEWADDSQSCDIISSTDDSFGDDESDDDDGSIDGNYEGSGKLRVNPIRASTQSIAERRGGNRNTGERRRMPLASGKIQIRHLRDLNASDSHKSIVTCLQFHRNSEVILSGGRDKALKLYRVKKGKFKRIESLHLSNCPIRSATFTSDGDDIMILSKDRVISQYNMHTGQIVKLPATIGRGAFNCNRLQQQNAVKGGPMRFNKIFMGPSLEDAPSLMTSNLYGLSSIGSSIMLCSQTTKSVVKTFHLNADLNSAHFHPSRSSIIAADVEGTIYVWDIPMGRCVQKVQCEALSSVLSVAVTPACGVLQSSPSQNSSMWGILGDPAVSSSTASSGYIAAGSTSGFVDLFPIQPDGIAPKPVKSFKNLVLPVGNLSFHPSGDLLFMGSNSVADACRLVHIPSQSVYSNWPVTQQSSSPSIGRVTASDFSRLGGYLAIGTASGVVRMLKVPALQ